VTGSFRFSGVSSHRRSSSCCRLIIQLLPRFISSHDFHPFCRCFQTSDSFTCNIFSSILPILRFLVDYDNDFSPGSFVSPLSLFSSLKGKLIFSGFWFFLLCSGPPCFSARPAFVPYISGFTFTPTSIASVPLGSPRFPFFFAAITRFLSCLDPFFRCFFPFRRRC